MAAPQIEDIERLVQSKSIQQRQRAVTPEQAPDEEEPQGTYVKKPAFKPPANPLATQLNKEMAEAAAVKFKKREKEIQKACAKLDNPDDAHPPQEQAGCCVIL